MSEQQDTSGSLDPLLKPFFQYWSGYAEQASQAMKATLGSLDDDTQPNELKRQWLDAVTGSMEAYLRSPFFLPTLKAHIDTLIDVKRRANELSKRTAHNPSSPPANDLAEVLKKLRCEEESPLAQLEEIEKRLAAIEAQHGRSSDAE